MAEKETEFFIVEIPLTVSPHQAKEINRRFYVARQMYNACLGEFLKRSDDMKKSEKYQDAKKMSKGRDRSNAFYELRKEFGITKFHASNYKTRFTKTWLNYSIGSKVASMIAQRAFIAVDNYLKGIRGRPKFKGYKNGITSLEHEPGNMSGIVWKGDYVYFAGGKRKKPLILKAIIRDDPVIQHALDKEVRSARILKRTINGYERFFCQLTVRGKPYERYEVGNGIVGLDIGPQTIAIVSGEYAELKQFCAELENTQAEIARLQRKIARQQRANNPDKYNEDKIIVRPSGKVVCKLGTNKKGVKGKWIKSNAQKENEKKVTELKRKEREYRKNLHNRLVNQIIQLGDTIRLEKISYKAFQKMFGRSVSKRAPGMFVAKLREKQLSGKLTVQEFSTFTTKLSQTCQCGRVEKKPLWQRSHKCQCGIEAQRDLYSAFLAMFVEDDQLDLDIAQEQWLELKPILDFALEDAIKNNVPNAL